MADRILIVAERINATRKRIGEALARRDGAFIDREAKSEAACGAHYVDVNAGRAGGDEPADLSWLVETVQGAVDLPLCVDSANPLALKAALTRVRRPALVNSVNGDPARIEGVLPLVVEHGASVVALTMEEGRMPENAAERVAVAERLAEAICARGISLSRVYFDPCVLAASASPGAPSEVLEAVRSIRSRFPEAHVISGLSNVSFGLPERSLLNRAFLSMMVACGADAFIMDPTDAALRAELMAAEVLSGRDEYALDYLAAAREGRLS